MPKVQFIDPSVARQAGEITFTPIPVNQYKKTITEEKANFSDADFLRIYHDMVVIREFETMLNLIKTTGEYSGVPYDHPGPAHLSAGQEAAAVGMAYTLTVESWRNFS
jgi:2-oxoisovalerate dehydrogenase E1 component